MDNLILLILGLFISVLGITNIKGNISTIHSYNRRKVKEEDIPKYGKVVGTGTLIMGCFWKYRHPVGVPARNPLESSGSSPRCAHWGWQWNQKRTAPILRR